MNNLYGDCRTNICNNPSTIYAEIFRVTLYKVVGTEKVYTTNNRFSFSVTARNVVKQYSFISNKEKFTFTDLTQDVTGVNVILNNNGDGTLTFYATHSKFYCPVILQILQSDGVINLTNFSDFTVKKSTLSNIVYASNLYNYDTTVTYANGWTDLKASRKTTLNRQNNICEINLAITAGTVTKETTILKVSTDFTPSVIKYGTVFIYNGTETTVSYVYINTSGELHIYVNDFASSKQVTGTIVYSL